jgi:hypothetical protein
MYDATTGRHISTSWVGPFPRDGPLEGVGEGDRLGVSEFAVDSTGVDVQVVAVVRRFILRLLLIGDDLHATGPAAGIADRSDP